jgi:phospholipid/cholesterol/gamma-HCH transport system substrate-binding protein
LNYYGRDKDIQVKVGLMTIITLLILLLGYSWLRDWFNRGHQEQLHVMFTNTGNIEVGNPVTVFGVKRGRVDNVSISPQGVMLTLRLDIDFPLPTDTRVVVSDSNLMGSRQVDVIPGSENNYITEGYVIQGESSSSFSSLVPKIDQIISEISMVVNSFSQDQEFADKLVDTIDMSHNIVMRIDKLLEDNQHSLNNTIENFFQAAQQLNELLAANKENITEAVSSAADSFERFDRSLIKIDSMVTTLEPLIGAMSKEEGTIHRLMTDEELYDKIRTATESIDSLLTDIKRSPRRYFKFSIF